MSILIKGMDEIPENGTVFTVMHDNGRVYIKRACSYGYSMELVKLPESHGRLIDGDALQFKVDNIGCFYEVLGVTEDTIDSAPTVIEAEGEP